MDDAEKRAYWNRFYAGRDSTAVPEGPSDFAVWVARRLQPDHEVVEIGFGTARDALWFAQHHDVLGFDFAESAVDSARERGGRLERTPTFAPLDLYDTQDVKRAVERIATSCVRPVVYGRFLVHAVEDHGRHNLLDLAAAALPGNGELYLEFRTGQDRRTAHAFGEDHYRQYVEPEVVQAEIVARGGSVVHLEAGHGLAVYRPADPTRAIEDPHVARLVATWP